MSQSRLAIIPSRAVADATLTATQLRVLCAIGSYTGKEQSAYPKQSTIAELLGISRETVNRAIKVLKKAGYVEVEAQFKNAGGGQSASLYYVRLDPCDDTITGGVTCDSSVTGGVIPTVTGGVTPAITPRTIQLNDTSSDEEVLEREPAPPPKKKKRTSGQTQIPTDWKPTASDIEYARKQNLTDQEIQNEADRFYRHHRAKGSRWKNWHLVWTNWLQSDFGPIKRKQRDASGDSGSASRGKPEASTFQAAAARMRRELQSCGQQVPAERGMDPRDEAPGHDQAELGFVINQ